MYSAVIVAAGHAKRTGLGYNKIFYKIRNKHLIEYSVDRFVGDKDCKEIIIVVSKEDLQQVRAIFSHPKIKYVIGGSTRQKSVFNGLSLVNEPKVLIHDGARPMLTMEDIQQIKQALNDHHAVTLYRPARDSIMTYHDSFVDDYLDRSNIGLILTPQAFDSALIKKAHSMAIKHKQDYTDDTSLIKAELNEAVYLLEGNEYNIKATTKYDLCLLEDIL